MAESNCAGCKFRGRYDKSPKSILGRIWRWHISWCPGWKSYMKSLTEGEKSEIKGKYNITS
ncbi:hypothetical protein ACFL1Z_04705 [Thermodesulfobacteriota bacterium]